MYRVVEAAKGELGVYVRSGGTNSPARFTIRGPSFSNLQALPAMATGEYAPDLVATLGSLDTIVGAVDRYRVVAPSTHRPRPLRRSHCVKNAPIARAFPRFVPFSTVPNVANRVLRRRHAATSFRRLVKRRGMSIGSLDDETVEKYREAGTVLREVLDEAADRVEPGVTHLEVAEFAEERIRERADGCAFPANISVNEEASHATPGRDDATEFGEDVVCLDCGVHVDGYIADAAVTVDHAGEPELVEAAEEALDAALDAIGPGVETGEVGAEIEDVIRGYGFNPILNLSGHGVAQWDAHTGPNIPNRGTDRGVKLEVGDVVAVEPFATTGSGKVSEGSKEEIYSLETERSVRNRQAREVMEQVTERYRTLPFATRWLDVSRAEMAVRRLERQGVLHGYPVLKEDDGALVSQAEHTVVVTEDGCEVITA